MGNGYDGWRMSNNARTAYANGEMPMSRWTKEELIAAVGEIDEAKADLMSNVKADTLKKKILKKTSWHHTSAKFNKTDFYSVDADAVLNATPDMIDKWAADTKSDIAKDVFVGDIRYLTWSGGIYSRHPQATNTSLRT